MLKLILKEQVWVFVIGSFRLLEYDLSIGIYQLKIFFNSSRDDPITPE